MGEEWPRICVNWGCDEYDERLRLGAELCAFRIFLLHFLLLLMKPKTLFIRRTVFSIYLFLNFLVSLSFFLWYEKSFALFPQTTLRPDRVYFIVGDEAAISTTEKFVWIWSYFLVIWINLLLKGTNKHWLTVGKKINSNYFHHHRSYRLHFNRRWHFGICRRWTREFECYHLIRIDLLLRIYFVRKWSVGDVIETTTKILRYDCVASAFLYSAGFAWMTGRIFLL